ncbi:MAG: CsgG/HfaB family protein [Gemmatimonadales bacterium]
MRLQASASLFAMVMAAMAPLELAAQRKGDPPPAALRGPRLRLGVLDLSGSALAMQTSVAPMGTSTTIAIPPPPDFSRGLTHMLTTALMDQQSFVVLERSQIDRVVGEQDLTNSGRVTPETTIRLGGLLGAQVLITGDITEYSYRQSSAGSTLGVLGGVVGRQLGAKAERVNAQVAIDLRILDATTGEVLGSARGQGKASSTAVGAEITLANTQFGVGGSLETPLGQASRKAIDHAVKQLVETLRDSPWRGRVSELRGSEVYINAGSTLGIAPGMEFEVFAQEKPVVDPESGAVLGTPDRRTGRIIVVRVAPKYAVARIVEGQGFRKNDVIRFRGQNDER